MGLRKIIPMINQHHGTPSKKGDDVHAHENGALFRDGGKRKLAHLGKIQQSMIITHSLNKSEAKKNGR